MGSVESYIHISVITLTAELPEGNGCYQEDATVQGEVGSGFQVDRLKG